MASLTRFSTRVAVRRLDEEDGIMKLCGTAQEVALTVVTAQQWGSMFMHEAPLANRYVVVVYGGAENLKDV